MLASQANLERGRPRQNVLRKPQVVGVGRLNVRAEPKQGIQQIKLHTKHRHIMDVSVHVIFANELKAIQPMEEH